MLVTSQPIPTGSGPRFMRSVVSLLLLWLVLPYAERANAQNVGVGTFTPNSSALLEILSTAKGVLIPRVTNTQMNAIVSPATGDFVYNSTMVNFYYWDGTQWVPLVGQGWSLTGDAGTSASVNFLGSKDSVDVVQKTNNRERMRFFAGANVGLTSNYNVAEQLQFFTPDGTDYTAFKAMAQSANVHYRLPLSDGNGNAALITDGAGNLSWKTFATIGGGGSDPVWRRGSGQRTLESIGASNHSSGQFSMTGGYNNFASGQTAIVWGSNNRGSGASATVAGGDNNSSSGADATVRGGQNNSASGSVTYVGGGYNNSTSGSKGVIIGGNTNTVSGTESVIINGTNISTSGNDNVLFGANITLAGSNQAIFLGPTATETRLGIRTSSPTQAMHVEGNVQFSSALKPNNNGGASGQYLLSAGSGLPPTWGTITVPTTNWALTGNAGTSPTTNFIGTTDAQAFVIRTSATEAMRVSSVGFVGIGTTAPVHRLHVVSTTTNDEYAAIYGEASSSSSSTQSVGVWGDADNTGSTNTGTIGVLAQGNKNTTAGQTDAALQINDGEFAMGRGTTSPSRGSVVESAASGTLYSQAGPSGVIELSLGSDLSSSPPTAGVYQDLGTVTINNRYITANSIVFANVIQKINGGTAPEPGSCIFKLEIDSRTAGSFTCHVGMIPLVTSGSGYQGSDHIRIGYVVINPGK